MKINVVVNSEQVSLNCLPSEIDASGFGLRSNSASLTQTPGLEKNSKFGNKGLGLFNINGKARGRSVNRKSGSKENEFKGKNKSLRPGKHEVNKGIPCVTIDLVKKVKEKLKK